MKKTLVAAGALVLFGFLMVVSGPHQANAGDATKAILEILHSSGDITDKEYEELKKKAKEEDNQFRTYFDKQLHIDSSDGRFKIQVGGRILTDAICINADAGLEDAAEAAGDTLDGVGIEFRQARIQVKGLLYNTVAFSNEFDFAGGEVSFQENWIEFQGLSYLGKMRVGHTKEPFSLERLNSRMYITFMERALPDGIVPGRNTGIRFLNFIDHPRLSWCVGIFKETDASGDGFSENGDYNITGRLTVTPWYMENGRKVLHLGLGYSHKIASEDLRFRQRPEIHISDFRPIDTGPIPADGADMFCPEIALVLGPFSLQGEYWFTRLDSETYDDPEFKGYYVAAGYFLTGENRQYRLHGNDGAEFSLVDIKSPFDPGKGTWGAWQVAVRYAYTDLNDNMLWGGEMANITLGVNWYLSPNVRWSFNYVNVNIKDSYAETDIPDADADIFQTRLQVFF